MYNSCYPQVAYTINVVELSKLPGYKEFVYGLGDRTYVVDPEFFGERYKEQVVITEIVEDLDDPSKNQIKVQNFKNQFQDLFQKITATVQQAQYNTGSYQKAVALAEANQERKQQFLTDALDSASARLSTAGQQSVTWGNDGITVKSINSPNDAIRMVGGAILLSKQDENGQQKWVTGVTSDGISASLITTGVLNAGEISIMNYDEPVFKWDSFGISAYDAFWSESDIGTTISGVNSKKFVRFDKYGIYGINGSVDGANWHPTGTGYNGDHFAEIDDKATFALTWEGLKVTSHTGNSNLPIVARLGKIKDGDEEYILRIGEEGDSTSPLMSFDVNGTLKVGAWSVSQNGLISIDDTQSTRSLRRTVSQTPNIFLVPDPIEVDITNFGKFIDEAEEEKTTDNIVFKAGDNFMVSKDGVLYTKDGYFTGMINATGGTIGQLQIKETYLSYTDINKQYEFSLGLNNNNVLNLTSNSSTMLNINKNGELIVGNFKISANSLTCLEAEYNGTSAGLSFSAPKNDTSDTSHGTQKISWTSYQNPALENRPFNYSIDIQADLYGEIHQNSYFKEDYLLSVKFGTYNVEAGYYANQIVGHNMSRLSWSISLVNDKVKAAIGSSATATADIMFCGAKIGTIKYYREGSTAVPRSDRFEIQMSTLGTLHFTVYIRNSVRLTSLGTFVPDNQNCLLGDQSSKWGDIYALNSTIGGSNLKEKKDIEPLKQEYEVFFDSIDSIRFKWIKNESDRYHVGFGAQNIRDNIFQSGLTTKDFAGYVEWDNKDGTKGYGLRYGEFIALNTWQIQKLKPRVSTLEQTILDYEARISALETEIQNLKS